PRDIIRSDIADGYMEMLIITTSSPRIVFIKFIALCLNNTLALVISMPFIVISYSLSFDQIMLNLLSRFILLVQISAISLFTGCIEGYFRSNTNLISFILFPLIIPSIIISGMVIYSPESSYLYISILLGFAFIITPIILLLSGYLLKNLYN
ncbi:MAG: heme exporter protein CcmB, partial [Pseudomonadota bacterium]